MREDSRTQLRRIRDSKMESILRSANKKLIISKADSCIEKVECFVKKEIAKGKSLEEAIKIVQENESILKTYTQLNDYQVKAVVFNTIRVRAQREAKRNKNEDTIEL